MTNILTNGSWNEDITNTYISDLNTKLTLSDPKDSKSMAYCKTTLASQENIKKYHTKEYGPANCNNFAVLHRPPVNLQLGRGCNLANPDAGVCDAWHLSPCWDNLDKCDNDFAPGGLADPRTDMDSYKNFKDFIRNGFIPDGCECQITTKLKELCKGDGKGTGGYLPLCPYKECDPLEKSYNKENFEKYNLPGEVDSSSGLRKDRICDISFEDSPTKKSNCALYIEKWAKTCKWCKDHNAFMSMHQPDFGSPCNSDLDCRGETTGRCLINDATKELLHVFDRQGICVSPTYNVECKICDSKLWDYVPGGWEAVIDENNPLHKVAKLSYVAKKQKTPTDNPQIGLDDYRLRVDILNGGSSFWTPNLVTDDTIINLWYNQEGHKVLSKSETPYCDTGPYTIKYWSGGSKEFVCEGGVDVKSKYGVTYKNVNKIVAYGPNFVSINNGYRTPIERPSIERTSTDSGKTNNTCAVICGSSTPYEWGTGTTNGLESVWNNGVINTEIGTELKGCPVTSDWYNGSLDVNSDNIPVSTRIMCKRNTQLTGQGLYDNNADNPTQSNYHIALNWVTGYVDLSDYGIPKDKYFDDKQTRQHLLEALRCCNGLPPTKDGDRKDCMPATTCPSNQLCKDIHSSIPNLPDYDSYHFGHDTEWDPKSSDRPEHYLKMYCEIMGGGSQRENKGVSPDRIGYDPEVAALCRKTMFGYASELVSVPKVSGNYPLESYKLPLRVFDDQVTKWCKGELYKSLPDQSGVCDILYGRACQQLQVDGWINPDNLRNSLLPTVFTSDGKWTEGGTQNGGTQEGTQNGGTQNGGTQEGTQNGGRTHTGLTGDKIKNACGCFLLGAECSTGDCSRFRCGAGSECDNLPESDCGATETCKWESGRCTNTLNVPVTLGSKELPKWERKFDAKSFVCSGDSCYKNCNYVNEYDVCWNAKTSSVPLASMAQWNCEDNSCEGGCVGPCSTDRVGYPNCGTDTWFADSGCRKIGNKDECVANEKCKWDSYACMSKISEIVPNFNKQNVDYLKWQNFYVQNAKTNENTIQIPGMGTSMVTSNAELLRMCNYKDCGNNNLDGVRPYKYLGTNELGCSKVVCNVSQSNVFNNYGEISGTVTISNSVMAKCGINFDNNSNITAADGTIRKSYLDYMGNIRDCDINSTCVGNNCCNDAKVCIYSSTNNAGDNCMNCDAEKSSGKTDTCCISTDLFEKSTGTELCYSKNPFNQSNTNLCASFSNKDDCLGPTSNKKCIWGTDSRKKNNTIVNTVGAKVSYICQDGCPDGSIDISELQKSERCYCSDKNTENECKTCTYCAWRTPREGVPGACLPRCPKPNASTVVVSTEKQQPEVPVEKKLEEAITSNIPLIAGTVGGVVGLGIIGLTIYLVLRKKKNP